jgi:hypothetical protein
MRRSARTVLCGGRSAMVVPTATLEDYFRFARYPSPIGGECRWNSSLTGAVLFFLELA